MPLENVDQCPKTHPVPTFSGNTSEAVGTFSGHYDYVYKDIFKDVPTVPSVPTIFEGTRVSEDEKQNPSSFFEPVGVVLKGNLRRMKQPSNLHAKPVPACAGPASLMATVWGVTICHRPTRPGIPFASSPTMAGRAAPPGCCIPTCERHPKPGRPGDEGGGRLNLWGAPRRDRSVPQIFTVASFGFFIFA